MPAIRHDDILLRLIKDVSYIRSILNKVTVALPLFDIANENTPVQITSDQNNYVPGNYDVLKISSDQAGRTITGIRGGIKGRYLRLINIGNYEIFLSHQSASSDAANRIISPTITAILINAGGEVTLYYDAVQERWIASYGSGGDRIAVDLQLSGDLLIPDATATYISWSSIIKDTGGFFDITNPQYITIPESGWYNLRTQLGWQADFNGYRIASIRQYLGSARYASDARGAFSGGSMEVNLGVTLYLPIGTKICVLVVQNSGAGLNMRQYSSTAVPTSFNVARM